MPAHKKSPQRTKKALDRFPGKRGPGRPGVRASEIVGRAAGHRIIFNQIWHTVGEALLAAQSEEDIIQALDRDGRYTQQFRPVASLFLQVLCGPDFPKQKREAQINFLAESLAGLGSISPRRCRDICERERAKEKNATYIIRYEYYIECSCGYKGRSRKHACPRCGARITLTIGADFADYFVS